MASGILGQSNPGAATSTTVYTVPSSTFSAFTVSAVSLSGAASVRVAISTSATSTPTNNEYIEFESSLTQTGDVLERSGLAAEAGRKVIVYSSTSNVSFSVYGFEEAV